MSSKKPTIEFYFDIVCQFAYTFSTQIDDICARYGVEAKWIPICLGGVYRGTNAPQGTKSATSVMSPSKRAWMSRDLMWRLNRLSVQLRQPKNWPMRTLSPQRLLTSIDNDSKRAAVAKAIYKAVWIDNKDITSRDVLNDICKQFNLNISAIDDPKIKQLLTDNTAAAVSRGVFGVPTVFINKTEMYFGVDRLDFIEHRLRDGKVLYPPTKRLSLNIPNPSQNTIDFYFDFSSPWAFLGWSRLHELVGFGRVVFKPVLLGAIFKGIGTPNAPILAMTDTKRNYATQDFKRWFRAAGVAMKFSEHFPIRTVLALRVFLADNRTIDCIYRAAWQQNINIGDPKSLCQVLDRNGFNGAELLKKAQNTEIKKTLRDNTQFAIDSGMFGVPTYVVNGDTDRFVWGQDRLDDVKDMCCGYAPPVVTRKHVFSKL